MGIIETLTPEGREDLLRVRELTRWNDTRGRTPTEVAALLRTAADVAGRPAAAPATRAA